MVIVGFSCQNTSGNAGTHPFPQTVIIINTSSMVSTTVQRACVKISSAIYTASCSIQINPGDYIGIAASAPTGRMIAIYRDDGINYLYIGGILVSTPTLNVTDNVNDANINMQFRNAYIITNSLKSSWSDSTDYRIAAFSNPGENIYTKIIGGNDSNDGESWGYAKTSIYNAMNTLISGGVLHIGFGDYSAQSAMTINKTMDILCETADAGGGTGTVIFPPTI